MRKQGEMEWRLTQRIWFRKRKKLNQINMRKKQIFILIILVLIIVVLAVALQQKRRNRIANFRQNNNYEQYPAGTTPPTSKTAPKTVPQITPSDPDTPPEEPIEEPVNDPQNNYQIGSYNYSLEYDGGIRTYRVHLPPNYNGQTPMPLVMAFHGTTGTSYAFEGTTKFSLLSNQEGFIVVYPQSLLGGNTNAPNETGWWFTNNAPVDDKGFIVALIDELISNLAIDETKIFATGSSNGAIFTQYLAYTLPGTFAGIATVGGTMGENTDVTPQPVPIIMFNGLLDGTVLYNGKPGVASIPEAFAKWSESNHCQGGIVSENIIEHDAVREEFTQCQADTVLYTLNQGEHRWYQWETPVIWEFFSNQ